MCGTVNLDHYFTENLMTSVCDSSLYAADYGAAGRRDSPVVSVDDFFSSAQLDLLRAIFRQRVTVMVKIWIGVRFCVGICVRVRVIVSMRIENGACDVYLSVVILSCLASKQSYSWDGCVLVQNLTSVWYLSRTSGPSREQRGPGRLKLAQR